MRTQPSRNILKSRLFALKVISFHSGCLRSTCYHFKLDRPLQWIWWLWLEIIAMGSWWRVWFRYIWTRGCVVVVAVIVFKPNLIVVIHCGSLCWYEIVNVLNASLKQRTDCSICELNFRDSDPSVWCQLVPESSVWGAGVLLRFRFRSLVCTEYSDILLDTNVLHVGGLSCFQPCGGLQVP